MTLDLGKHLAQSYCYIQIATIVMGKLRIKTLALPIVQGSNKGQTR